MQQIDFYIVPHKCVDDSLALIAGLCKKVYQQQSLDLLLADPAAAQKMSQRLWTFQPEIFLPHRIATEHPEKLQIRKRRLLDAPAEILLNLTAKLDTPHRQYARVLQLVLDDPAFKQSARRLYQEMKQQNITIKNHNLTATPAKTG
jgi:DNA polymerase-3 subunit chi